MGEQSLVGTGALGQLVALAIAGILLAPLDGCIAIAAGALLVCDTGLVWFTWLTDEFGGWLSNHDLTSTTWGPMLLVAAVLLAGWGLAWTRRRSRAMDHLTS
jgi:hypothetical protein